MPPRKQEHKKNEYHRNQYPDLLSEGKTPSMTGKQVQQALGFNEPNSINTLARQDPENHRYLPSYINPGDGWQLAGPNTNYQRWFFPEHVEIWDQLHPKKERDRPQDYFKKIDEQMIAEVLTVAAEMREPDGRVNRQQLHKELRKRYPGRWSRWWYQSMALILDNHGIPAKRRQAGASRRAAS